MRLPPRRTRRFAPCLAALAGLLASCAASAQHPGHQPQWPDPAPAPCADIADGPRRDACLARAEARKAAEDAASRRYHLWLADRLAEDGGARNLAIAANLRAIALGDNLYGADVALPALDGDAKLADWIARATREGRDDALVLTLLHRRFGTHDDPRRKAVLARWQAIEPDNVAPWRFEDEIANADADTLLARSEHATHVELHYIDTLRTVVAAFERHPPRASLAKRIFVGETSTLRDYAGAVASAMFTFPRFSPAINACKGEGALAIAGRSGACLRYGRLQADHSDTLIDQLMGLAILRFNAEDDVSLALYMRRRRHLLWLSDRWRNEGKAHREAVSDAMNARMNAKPAENNEATLLREVLEDRGVSLTPPDDWEPGYL